MHSFLVYLQMAPMEQQPAIACLLLQLDLLVCSFQNQYNNTLQCCINLIKDSTDCDLQVEPRKMSIYREEATETLIDALRRKDFPICQIMALDAFASLSGGLTASGKSVAEAWLLKTAGLDKYYNVMLKDEGMGQENESLVSIS